MYKITVSAPASTTVAQNVLDQHMEVLSLRASRVAALKTALGEEEFVALLHTTVENYFADNLAEVGKVELKGDDGSYAAYDVLGWTVTPPPSPAPTLFVKQVGKTTERPSLDATQPGTPYFDTTLGLPVWWTGALWIDANGRPV